jgi:outer membrane lipoprotein-sorting protein
VSLANEKKRKEKTISMKRTSFFSRIALSKTAFSKVASSTLVFSVLCLVVASGAGFALNKKPPKPAKAPPAQACQQAPSATPGNERDAVLARMNQTAAGFRSAQGDFEFETYQKLVDEKEQQKGRIYFRRKSGVDAAFEIDGPAPKQVVYKDGKLRIYEKKINQVTERDVDKNKQDVEAFLSLGFGARGTDLLRDYDVKMAGWETVDGVKTAKLDLIPKNEKMRQTYEKIVLWIDPERDVLLRQQFFEPSGDYRLAHYTNMKLNENIAEDHFHLKTTGKPTIVKP